jgi:hypothetical protein
MSSLQIIPPAQHWRNDEVAPALLRVTLTGLPVSYRIAQVEADLPYADWRPQAAVFDVAIQLPGYQSPGPATYALEVRYADMSTEVVVSPPITRGTPTAPPDPTVPPVNYLMRATFETSLPLHCQQYNDTTPRPGNNFIPFDWSPGYAWSTERTRGIDVGETPNDIIAAHTYARWTPGSPNTWDFSPNTTTLHAKVAGQNLDLKGGKLYFAVLCVHPDGKRGRYHLYGNGSRALTVGIENSFTETTFTFPSSSNADWKCSFGADSVPIANMPPGPSFAIEAVELIIRDFSAPPTGQLRIKEFAVIQ